MAMQRQDEVLLSDLEFGASVEKVLNDFGEEILGYGPSPDEREEHLATLGKMMRRVLAPKVPKRLTMSVHRISSYASGVNAMLSDVQELVDEEKVDACVTVILGKDGIVTTMKSQNEGSCIFALIGGLENAKAALLQGIEQERDES